MQRFVWVLFLVNEGEVERVRLGVCAGNGGFLGGVSYPFLGAFFALEVTVVDFADLS